MLSSVDSTTVVTQITPTMPISPLTEQRASPGTEPRSLVCVRPSLPPPLPPPYRATLLWKLLMVAKALLDTSAATIDSVFHSA